MDTFFGIPVSVHSTAGMALVLLLSVLMGGLIGVEREFRGRAAGLRTHILVCLGSTLLTLVSINIAPAGRGDPGRIAAQIVSGIGFLGAGAILREGANVRGLTTAASIWTTAAIGLALGAGPRFGELAVLATVIVVFTLQVLNRLEDWMDTRIQRLATIRIAVRNVEESAGAILARLAHHKVFIRGIEYHPGDAEDVTEMHVKVRYPPRTNPQVCIDDLSDETGVLSVRAE